MLATSRSCCREESLRLYSLEMLLVLPSTVLLKEDVPLPDLELRFLSSDDFILYTFICRTLSGNETHERVEIASPMSMMPSFRRLIEQSDLSLNLEPNDLFDIPEILENLLLMETFPDLTVPASDW